TPDATVTPPLLHSLGAHNRNRDANFDWLVHLDRIMISPIELLHVAQCQPAQLTQKFWSVSAPRLPGINLTPQGHAPKTTWFDNNVRIYRALEFFSAGERSAGNRKPDPLGTGAWVPNDRTTGKININSIWDPEILLAIYDANSSNVISNPAFIGAGGLFSQLLQSRSPSGGVGQADRPFLPLSTGPVPAGDPQYPWSATGLGIDDTLLRAYVPLNGLPTPANQRLLEVQQSAALGSSHPYLQYQMLTKVFDRFTVRSNVFAV